jgi:hypothetical protein
MGAFESHSCDHLHRPRYRADVLDGVSVLQDSSGFGHVQLPGSHLGEPVEYSAN